MKMSKQERSGIMVLTLRGEFDSFVTAAFLREVEALVAEGFDRIVLNLRSVKFINSTALGAMLKVRKQCLASGGQLVVSHPASTVREAMESLHLDHLFSIFETDDDAVIALGGTLGGDDELTGEDGRDTAR